MDKLINGCLVKIFRKVGVIGDSLSSGEHESLINGIKEYHDYYEYSWGQYIARDLNIDVYNFSKGGLACKTFFKLAKEKDFYKKDLKCQAYIIALGENDLNHLSDFYKDGFGSIDDIDFNNKDNNKDSYIGWYSRIIQTIKEIEPKARIFLTTTPRYENESDIRKSLHDKSREILIEFSKLFQYTYVIDLRQFAPIYDDEFKKTYYLGGHMNVFGYMYTAEMIEKLMDKIIRDNIDDFMQVAFIGKDKYNENYKW